MVRKCLFFLYALSLFIFTGCNIEGRLTSYDGKALSGVKVSLNGDASLTTITDSQGYYTFKDLSSGSYTIRPLLKGHKFHPPSQIVDIDEDDIFGVDFEAEPNTHIRVPRDYDTIQAAVDAASDGDIIWIADGTYSGYGNYDVSINKWITIQSENGPQKCIIDCRENGRGFLLAADVTLSGFTIINGLNNKGGAIATADSASPKISRCIIRNNYGMETGGGIFTSGGYPRIINCTITGNKTDHDGGGLSFDEGTPTIFGCTISNNEARKGGGIYGVNAAANLKESVVSDNSALDTGGGWYSYGGDQDIKHTFFYKNVAEVSGAGLHINLGNSDLFNCTIADNKATDGSGVYVGFGKHGIANCILWNNSVKQIEIDSQASMGISHSIVGQDDIIGIGNCVVNTDPEFTDNESYHLLENSPCAYESDAVSLAEAFDNNKK